ncbi:DUF6993 domain-containing protein [Paenarthrobacter sp. NPDC057981]|uniref:DUF6993 domain-containing protein n=1 Tax=Paenarthrobacter sp. NPDC057981 TaxID=3346297 RepID=UPI0036D9ED8B
MAAQASTTSVRRSGGALMFAATVVMMAACTAAPASPTPAGSSTQPAGIASQGTGSAVPSAGAETNPSTGARPSESPDPAVLATTKTVESTLKSLVAGNPKPDRESLRAALVSAGIPEGNLEVSVSRTPTGLDVDAIEAAALSGNSCVMGQIRDGGVVVTVLPVLATGKCFVGDAR